jgi:hypothetical protein
MAVVCLPAGQFLHVDEAIAAAYLPAMQSTQVAALVAAMASDALPAAQLVHTASPLDVAPGLPYLPAGHGVPVQVERVPTPTS